MNLIISAIIISIGLIIAGSLIDIDTIVKTGDNKELITSDDELITQIECLYTIQEAVRAAKNEE